MWAATTVTAVATVAAAARGGTEARCVAVGTGHFALGLFATALDQPVPLGSRVSFLARASRKGQKRRGFVYLQRILP